MFLDTSIPIYLVLVINNRNYVHPVAPIVVAMALSLHPIVRAGMFFDLKAHRHERCWSMMLYNRTLRRRKSTAQPKLRARVCRQPVLGTRRHTNVGSSQSPLNPCEIASLRRGWRD
jgi:hypothetical protein